MAVQFYVLVFWAVTPGRFLSVCKPFGGSCCLHLRGTVFPGYEVSGRIISFHPHLTVLRFLFSLEVSLRYFIA